MVGAHGSKQNPIRKLYDEPRTIQFQMDGSMRFSNSTLDMVTNMTKLEAADDSVEKVARKLFPRAFESGSVKAIELALSDTRASIAALRADGWVKLGADEVVVKENTVIGACNILDTTKTD